MSGSSFFSADPDATRVATSIGGQNLGPGTILSHTYRIEALLARGGMGEVYRARHNDLGTEHAIKVIRSEFADNPEISELFRREAGLLRALRSDAVVGYDGVFRDEAGRLFLVMEFVDGPSIAQVLKERRFTVDECFRLRDRMAEGLQALHERGVVHRDISPDNIILPNGQLELAKLIDLGIAKQADPMMGTIIGNTFAGKLGWASPEQLGLFGGHVDSRSDIYSFGLVLAACAAGKALPTGSSHSEILKARYQVPDLSDIPEALKPGLRMMLQPDPADRPASMAEVLGAASGPAAEPGAERTKSGLSRPGPSGRTMIGERTSTSARPSTARPTTATKAAPAQRRSAGAGGWLLSILVLFVTLGAFLGAYLYFLEPHYHIWSQFFGPLPWQEAGLEEPIPETPEAPELPPVLPRPPQPQPQPQPETPQNQTPPVEVPPQPVEQPPTVPVEQPPVEQPPVEQPVNNNPPPVPETPPAPQISLASVSASLAGIAGQLSCADLSAVAGAGGGFSVAGFVATEADRQSLLTSLAGMPGVTADPAAVSVFGLPYCRTVKLLRQDTAVGDAAGGAPMLATTSGSQTFAEGDTLALRVGATQPADRFLHVAYLDHEGSVLHMYPPADSDGQLSPGQPLTIDSFRMGDTVQKFIISPPFGTDLIVAIASPAPLFDPPRPLTETVDQFLPALSQALDRVAGGQGRPGSSYIFVTTKPR